ncbi:MAG: hypothetical protein JRI58_01710 [Deltaproteobacteria bacterium]|nr:hypothetical protein [Deltaproteobacteria bacterium]
MITKENIRQYLDKLSSGIGSEQGQMPSHVWQKFHEYIVTHYKRLDKETRAYANEIFDQMEASLEQRIESLPESSEKKTLSRKLAVVRGERPPLPVLYLDTPVIEVMIKYALGQHLPRSTAENSEALCKGILALVKDEKLICPEDNFHREALQLGGIRAREGLNAIRRLSHGLSFKHSQAIEDFQIFRALRGFIDGYGPIDYKRFWQDAFETETVNAIVKKHASITFKDILALAEKPGPPEDQQARPSSLSTRLRIRYDEASLKYEQKLQQRSTRHLRDLVRLGMKYQNRMREAQKQHLDGFWAGQKLDLPIALWNGYGGKPEGLEGLVSFYESEYFRNIPAIKIKWDIWHTLSADHAGGLNRLTGPADVNILSYLLPYTDIMILGRKMTDVVRDKLRFDLMFKTAIYSMDEHDLIMAALKEIARAE